MTDEYDGAPSAGADEPSDPELIAAVRGGAVAMFAVLYHRHVDAARRFATALARDPGAADDLVAEAFAGLLGALQQGGGPDIAVRIWLFTALRDLSAHRRADGAAGPGGAATGSGRHATGPGRHATGSGRHAAGTLAAPLVAADQAHRLTARAFTRLPEQWQAVLWHAEVQREPPATVAPLLDLTPNGVAALAYRARDRLREDVLREHLAEAPTEECQRVVDQPAAHVRGRLPRRQSPLVQDHLSGCRRCRLLYAELGEINAGLRGVLAPVVLGTTAAAAFLGAPGSAGGAGVPVLAYRIRGALRRRSSRVVVGAGLTVMAALVTLTLVLVANPPPVVPLSPVAPPPAASGPVSAPPDAAPVPTADVPAGPGPGDGPIPPDQAGFPGTATGPAGVAGLQVRLEAVGALVRDRPGVVALTVVNTGPAGGGSGGGTSGGPPLTAGSPLTARSGPESGELTALITVPAGVNLRDGAPIDGWTCEPAGGDIRCTRPSLPAGSTSRAFLPLSVSADAADGDIRVNVTAPAGEVTSATSSGEVSGDGLAATFAGVMPATVVVGGNSLLSCPELDPACRQARTGGQASGRVNNGDYQMTRYAAPDAPRGAPRRAMVSGASIAMPGEVVWAGLYWAGTGRPPARPTAYLRTPTGRGYAEVAAARVDRFASGDLGRPAYQASAEVTELVRGASGGTWWVAVPDGAFDRGSHAFGGWALLMIVDDGGPARAVAVMEGRVALRADTSFTTPIFTMPGGSAQVAFVGWDGDRGIDGSRLRLGDAPLGGDASDNIAASRADGTPEGWNTFGTDARILDGQVPLEADQLAITAGAGRDAWLLNALAVVTTPHP